MEDELKRVIVDFPDYPKPGIMFKDISPILMDMNLYRKVINEFATRINSLNIDLIVGIESRGFWFGPAIADSGSQQWRSGEALCTIVSLAYWWHDSELGLGLAGGRGRSPMAPPPLALSTGLVSQTNL